ncbi:MAG: DUF342 domain-containing protein [Bacillota bacterium]
MGNGKGIDVTVSTDKMSAYLKLSGKGDWSLREIRQALETHGVVFGISNAAIRTCLLGKRDTPYQVAWGLPPHDAPPGRGALAPRIVFNFGQSQGKPPDSLTVTTHFRDEWRKILARGAVRAGAILAFVRNLDKCSLGLTVTGEKLPFFANKPILRCGPNTTPSRDGKYIIASKSGIPYVDRQKPGVLGRLEVIGSIGPETGDISFPGDLTVKGDVFQGFRISSWGSLTITGNLSGSASCAQSITVEGGINAPGEIVESGSNVTGKFCENSVIRAYGDVVISESIMHSIVETEQELKLSKNKGRIVGGLIRAGIGVSAYCAGSAMGVPTVIEVGASPKIRRECERLRREITALKSEIERIKRTGSPISPRANQMTLDQLRLQRMSILFEDKEKGLYTRLVSLEEAIRKSKQGYFNAELVLPGTTLTNRMDTIEFTCPEHRIAIGVRGNEAN